MTPVSFWSDPSCSFSWITSRWLLEASKVRDLDISWRVMSLAILHEHSENLTESYQRYLTTTWLPVRVLVAASEEHGSESVRPLYDAMGTRFWVQKMPRDRDTVVAALDEAGLPRTLADAADTDAYDDVLRRSHDAAMELVGHDVGTPTVGVGTTGFFGPVLTKAPRGEDAGRLWDAALTFASFPHFHELKRTRDLEQDFS